MTDNVIPPCGPERDRLVAEAVGWTWVEYADAIVVRCPSSSDPDALAALEAWCKLVPGRAVSIDLYFLPDGGTMCSCWDHADPDNDMSPYVGRGFTLRDAATAALVRWRNERSQS